MKMTAFQATTKNVTLRAPTRITGRSGKLFSQGIVVCGQTSRTVDTGQNNTPPICTFCTASNHLFYRNVHKRLLPLLLPVFWSSWSVAGGCSLGFFLTTCNTRSSQQQNEFSCVSPVEHLSIVRSQVVCSIRVVCMSMARVARLTISRDRFCTIAQKEKVAPIK
jgi:hypothetical protein